MLRVSCCTFVLLQHWLQYLDPVGLFCFVQCWARSGNLLIGKPQMTSPLCAGTGFKSVSVHVLRKGQIMSTQNSTEFSMTQMPRMPA